jgi:glycosyltransferase involved in cell wall biosynthesis
MMAQPMNPENKLATLFFSNLQAGGIQRAMLTLAGGLLRRGWAVDLLVVNGNGPLRQDIPPLASIIDFNKNHAVSTFGEVTKYLQTNNPNVMLSSQTHINTIAILAKMLSGWKGRLVLNEQIAILEHAKLSAGKKNRYNPLVAKLLYRFGDAVLAVSQAAADELRQVTGLPAERVSVAYNPIVNDEMIERSYEAPNHRWFRGQAYEIVLAAGRFTEQKDFLTLISAFKTVSLKHPNSRLVILGEGKLESEYRVLIKKLGLDEVVDLPGFQANPYSFMRHSQLFVLSSRWEGFGNVLVEAMACGTPVVSTDCPHGPSEVLENGKYGDLVAPGNETAMAEAIINSLDTQHNRDALIARSLDFSVEKIIVQYEKTMTGFK